jgi:predicted nucleic acid-binding protein
VGANCVLDASLILSIASANAFPVLWAHPGFVWHISGIVRSELRRKNSRDPIDAAIAAGHLLLIELDTSNSAQMKEWAKWLGKVDRGEAEAIAIASTNGCLVAIEDRQAQRAIDANLGPGRWINCGSLLIDAVRGKRLSEAAADKIFHDMDCYGSYAKAGLATIADLLAYPSRTPPNK